MLSVLYPVKYITICVTSHRHSKKNSTGRWAKLFLIGSFVWLIHTLRKPLKTFLFKQRLKSNEIIIAAGDFCANLTFLVAKLWTCNLWSEPNGLSMGIIQLDWLGCAELGFRRRKTAIWRGLKEKVWGNMLEDLSWVVKLNYLCDFFTIPAFENFLKLNRE